MQNQSANKQGQTHNRNISILTSGGQQNQEFVNQNGSMENQIKNQGAPRNFAGTDVDANEMNNFLKNQDLMSGLDHSGHFSNQLNGLMTTERVGGGINQPRQSQIQNNIVIDKELVKTTLKDLKENYKHIEREIEETTKKQRDQQHTRYQKVMDLIESLKQSLKTEVNNRKETEEQFMEIVEKRKQEIHNQLTLKYLNNIYIMKEKLGQFNLRKDILKDKLEQLQYQVDQNLTRQHTYLYDQVEKQKEAFRQVFEDQMKENIKKLKHLGEIEYNFNNMLSEIESNRENDAKWLKEMTHITLNDENTVYQKQEATRKLILSQINFLKQNLKVEIDSRRTTDQDIWNALDKYKELIQEKIITKRNDIKNKKE